MDKSIIKSIKFKIIMMKKSLFGIMLGSLSFVFYSCESQNSFENAPSNVNTKNVKSVSDSIFYCPVKVYANTVQNYMYNTGDLPGYDYIAFYIDKSPSEYDNENMYPDTITLRNDTYHNSKIRLPYGKHHITTKIRLDDGCGIFTNCAAYVTSVTKDTELPLLRQDIDAEEDTGSNAEFQFEFDIDVPYSIENTDNTIDIRLMFNEGLEDPNYITGRALIHTFYDWDSSLKVSGKTWWNFSIDIVDYPTGDIRTYNKSTTDYVNYNTSMDNISYQFKSLWLPSDSYVNYNLYLRTDVSVETITSKIIKDSEISWYSAYYRERFYDGSYTDWYIVDELTSSYIGIDATVDFYSDLEIACFKSKTVYDLYAPSLGIDF